MSNFSTSDSEMLRQELYTCSETLLLNKQRLEENSWLAKPITFWMESTRFLISEMEIWDQLQDRVQYELTFTKARSAIVRLQELIQLLMKEE